MTTRVPKNGRPKVKLRVIGVMVNGKMKNKPLSDFSASDRQYFRDLHKIIDEVFEEAHQQHEWTWSQLADQANLAYQTVCNLGDRVTKYPRFLTVYRLAKAVGWEVVVRQPKTQRKASSLKVAKAG